MPATYSIYKPSDCSANDIDNIRCNTIAAARYIKHLQERFKSITVLVKAYNRGGTNFIRKGTTHEAEFLSRCVSQYIVD